MHLLAVRDATAPPPSGPNAASPVPGWTAVGWPGDATTAEPRPVALLDSAALGLRPLYVVPDPTDPTDPATPARALAVSTDPALLAAHYDRPLDPDALADDLQFGFLLGGASRFAGVRRVEAGSCVRLHPGASASVEPQPPANGAATLQDLARALAGHVDDATAIELTGGFDSRLCLALSIAGGPAPKVAFTLGDPNSADARAAAALAASAGVAHHVVPIEPDAAALADDAAELARAGAYLPNAASYGWMPSVYRRLDALRDRQLTGAGGEIATGFYHSAFDRLLSDPPRQRRRVRAWVRYRLRLPGGVGPTVGAQFDRLEAAIERATNLLTRKLSGDWRARTDDLYRLHRVRQWAGAVLTASGRWYQPIAPLLSPHYLRWADAAEGEGRGRHRQLGAIRELAPALLDAPWASDFAPPATLWAKVTRRLRGRRGAGDLGAAATAVALARDDFGRGIILALAESGEAGLDASALRRLLDDPAAVALAAREVGTLFCAALARHDADAHRRRLEVAPVAGR